ncbi:MAG: RusA family crossover junction endodeoxyribonuclease [Alphaproteobacteria bacterium]|nr:RusA family crossover junction endodeoxyribonuclease [Alphaproteobacteria bacterium]
MQRIDFSVEFVVAGRPVVAKKTGKPRDAWRTKVQNAALAVLANPGAQCEDPVTVTIYHFPETSLDADLDNIAKLLLDGMNQTVYQDDKQVERIVMQKFEELQVISADDLSDTLLDAVIGDGDRTYIRVENTIPREFG